MGSNLIFTSGKIYPHSVGLSCCFRQWRAESHCNRLHGYALQVETEFGCHERDKNGWVVDFGGLSTFKADLQARFDHKTLVAEDDPELNVFKILDEKKMIDLRVCKRVGVEAFAEEIFQMAEDVMHLSRFESRCFVNSVTVREHEANWAKVTRDV
jgi:6-pyruvoyltetrahydropterin/6-carboxytetrahydropterin synthase